MGLLPPISTSARPPSRSRARDQGRHCRHAEQTHLPRVWRHGLSEPHLQQRAPSEGRRALQPLAPPHLLRQSQERTAVTAAERAVRWAAAAAAAAARRSPPRTTPATKTKRPSSFCPVRTLRSVETERSGARPRLEPGKSHSRELKGWQIVSPMQEQFSLQDPPRLTTVLAAAVRAPVHRYAVVADVTYWSSTVPMEDSQIDQHQSLGRSSGRSCVGRSRHG